MMGIRTEEDHERYTEMMDPGIMDEDEYQARLDSVAYRELGFDAGAGVTMRRYEWLDDPSQPTHFRHYGDTSFPTDPALADNADYMGGYKEGLADFRLRWPDSEAKTPAKKTPAKIELRFKTIDGLNQLRRYKSVETASRAAVERLGNSPEIGRGYVVSGDGIVRMAVELSSVSLLWKDLFPRI